MSEQGSDLHSALEQLRRQLRQIPELDPVAANKLEDAIADVERSLSSTPSESRHANTLVERLSEAARHFEDSHPNLSGTIGGVIDAIGRMGI